MKVALIYGGTSTERVPSEKNAKSICEALTRRGYKTELINYDEKLFANIEKFSPDIVFLCVQGKYHGDGTLQAILDFLHIPYTGSGTAAAALINDKIKCKIIFDYYGHKTPKWYQVTRKQYDERSADFGQIGYPFVAKAPTQGGSFGISLVRSENEIGNMEDPFMYDDTVLCEGFVDGRPYTVAVLQNGDSLTTLPCIEMLDKRINREEGLILMSGDYSASKAELPESVISDMEQTAKDIFAECGAADYARIDFMVDEKTVEPYVIEINAVPGLKQSSLMPIEAQLAGIEYDDLIEGILLNAARRYKLC